MPVNTYGIVTDECYFNELMTFVQINFLQPDVHNAKPSGPEQVLFKTGSAVEKFMLYKSLGTRSRL